MSALRDGESTGNTFGFTDEIDLDSLPSPASVTTMTTFSELTRGPTYRVRPERHWLPLRRLWFLVSCIPRYLITGSVEVP